MAAPVSWPAHLFMNYLLLLALGPCGHVYEASGAWHGRVRRPSSTCRILSIHETIGEYKSTLATILGSWFVEPVVLSRLGIALMPRHAMQTITGCPTLRTCTYGIPPDHGLFHATLNRSAGAPFCRCIGARRHRQNGILFKGPPLLSADGRCTLGKNASTALPPNVPSSPAPLRWRMAGRNLAMQVRKRRAVGEADATQHDTGCLALSLKTHALASD